MDIRQEITNKIIAMLEQGGNVAQKRWISAANSGFPSNGKTGASYRGVNVLLLWWAALESDYTTNIWMTYKQAADMGAQVRKGEKGTMCAYFEMLKKKSDKKAGADESEEFFPMCKPFWLFNIAQIDGLPETLTAPAIPDDMPVFNPIEAAEKVLTNSGANIRHGYDSAFYAPSQDQVCLPNREMFTSTENYYATAIHELTHWTGHKSRLDRKFGKRFGDDAYAFEELVAELGAAFVAGSLGFVDMTIEQHASYLESWLRVLKNDKTAIFTAAKHAGLAYDFIMGETTTEAAQATE